MPILPSEVDGVEPGLLVPEGSEDRTRLRQLCEALLTARAKMLGLSKSFSHRLSGLPDSLKAPLVQGLGEIVAHLDSFEIRLGDTRLSGKARLGADAGMEAHFPDDRIEVVSPGMPEVVDAPAPRRRRGARQHALEAKERRVLPPPESAFATAGEGDGPPKQEWAREMERKAAAKSRGVDPPSEARAEGIGFFLDQERLWGRFQARRAAHLSPFPLSREDHETLVWVCLSVVFGHRQRRPESFDVSVGTLLDAGYVAREDKRWKPTRQGLEASGLCGFGHLDAEGLGFR